MNDTTLHPFKLALAVIALLGIIIIVQVHQNSVYHDIERKIHWLKKDMKNLQVENLRTSTDLKLRAALDNKMVRHEELGLRKLGSRDIPVVRFTPRRVNPQETVLGMNSR